MTNQNIAYANVSQDNNGRVRGTLQISNPEQFWTNSKFLILVEN